MFAETSSSQKMSRARIAFGLLAGLAVCCSVMYFTSDASDEFIHESFVTETVKSNGKDLDAGTSVGNTDVLKAGQIYTDTPDGIMRLMDYFTNVEKEIADEVSKRKSDIAMVRAKMARDFAFNSAARSKLKRSMMHKMAVNAKIARDDMAAAMRKTQRHFAKQAHLANRRYKATLRRDHRTRKLVRKNAREAKRNLKLAVSQWQKNQHAFAAATNAKINRMNKEVSANAAQIKTNAKKARKDLEKMPPNPPRAANSSDRWRRPTSRSCAVPSPRLWRMERRGRRHSRRMPRSWTKTHSGSSTTSSMARSTS